MTGEQDSSQTSYEEFTRLAEARLAQMYEIAFKYVKAS